ncbi:DMT family transporter [Arcobacter sp. LA11]|uniref:DMT family transporter n=1 Tax=Arcobacter sp. LA11 TaxID=1898176 RepID=UPI0009F8E765|nr:DMT family transporter [Arcobacter sp. LA11]
MNKNLFYILMIFAMIFWGASWINVKVLSNYINEYEVVFLRVGISLISMIPILFYLKLSFKITIKTAVLVLFASLVLVLYSIFFFLGVKNGTAGLGGALVTTLIPINTFIIIALMQHKIISLKHSFALILGGFGVLTMLNIWEFNISDIFSIQNIYFLLASFLWPALTIISSKATKTNPLIFTFYVYIVSSIIVYLFFIDYSLFEKIINFDYIFWLNIFVLSILATTFATSIYFIGIEKLGTKEVSSFIFLVPSSALVFSAVFLDEKITFNTLLGTICTVVAIYILNDLKINFIKKLIP